LEQSIARFVRHQRPEVIEAFLQLVERDNATVKQILLDPFHGCYLGVVDLLLHSQRGGIVRLLLSYLDDPHPPTAAISALARRCDPKFIGHLLKKIGDRPSPQQAQNLKRVESVPWADPEQGVVDMLDDASQHSLVKMLAASGVKRSEVFRTLEHLALRGTPGGRRAAFEELAGFSGVEANALIMAALEDPDPLVQAAAARQLRQRGVPGALSRLVELIDSPHQVLRDAVRASLSEFQFSRYLASFDLLDTEVRAANGRLVRKVDPRALSQLIEELRSRSRSRRLRAIEMAVAMDLLAEAEGELIERLRDEDHIVRSQAARALAARETAAVQDALHEALLDRSDAVRDAAAYALQEIGRRLARSRQPQPQPPAAEEIDA
jgi:hypothetical protein